MSGAATRRPGARQRLKSGFLAGLPAQLREILGVLETDRSPEARDSVAHALKRVAETAGSLGLVGIAREAGRLAMRVPVSARLTFRPLVAELRSGVGTGCFAPIAVVGRRATLGALELLDDGVCEPLLLFESADELREGTALDWPQAVLLPADQAPEVVSLASELDCPVYLYGDPRDTDARRRASRVGAEGYFAEPLVLHEVLAQLRHAAAGLSASSTVALFGPMDWLDVAAASARASGLQVEAPGGLEQLTACLHSSFPHAVIFGPDELSRTLEAIAVARQHLGRVDVALLAVGDPEHLGRAGVDDVLDPTDPLGERVCVRLARLRERPTHTDPLTQLPSRPAILAEVQRSVARVARGDLPVTVAIVELRGLGEAAVEHGRQAANACRRHLGATLQRGLRAMDRVGVLTEDRFVAILPGCRTRDAAIRLAQVREAFEARVHADRRLRGVQLGVGVASTERGARGLMLRATEALEAEWRDAQP